jgi:hypothetical protein
MTLRLSVAEGTYGTLGLKPRRAAAVAETVRFGA